MNENSRLSLYADLGNLRKGDTVFFYQRRIDEPRKERGFRGIYEVISDPFFDSIDVDWGEYIVLGKCSCGCYYSEKTEEGEKKCPMCGRPADPKKHILPNRVLIRAREYFEKPVDDNTAYINHTNHGSLWTMLFRKIFGPGRERSVTPILPEESEKLIRLLKRVNDRKTSSFNSKPYPSSPKNFIKIELGDGPKVPYENTLVAWMTRNIDKDFPVLKDVIGPREELEFWGNHVLYGIGGEKVDLLCLHKKEYRYKATVMELKMDVIDLKAINQISDYSYWIAQLSTANLSYPVKNFIIQPVLIGYRAARNVLSMIRQMTIEKFRIPYQVPCEVTIYKPILMLYRISNGSINFRIEENLSRGSILDYT
jgi:hypothetical protein